MKITRAKNRRVWISLLLTAVMLVSVFGDCSAVLAMSQGVAAGAAGNEAQQAEPGDADNAADGVVQGAEEVQNDETPVIEEESVSPKGAMEAQAASPKVTVKADYSGRTVTVSWKPDSSLEGPLHYGVSYSFVDYQDPANLSNPQVQTKDIKTEADNFTDTSIKKKLVYFNEYTFKVTAFNSNGEAVAEGTAAVTPEMSKPPKSSSVTATSGVKKVTLKWKAIKTPSDDSDIVIWYRVYVNGKLKKKIKDSGKKTYSLTFKAATGSEKKLSVRTVWRKDTPGHQYKWTDVDTKKSVTGTYQLVLGTKKTVKRGPIRPIKYKFTVTGSGTYYTSYKGTGVGGHLKAGKKYTATGAINTRYIISVNGKTRWMPTKYSKNRSAEYKNGSKTYNGKEGYYSQAEAENFVNTKKVGSRTSYLIWVSAYAQRCFLFKKSGSKWDCKNDYLCSTGGLNTPTPTGHLRIWSRLMTRHGLRYWNNFYSLTALHQSPAKTMGYPSSRGGCVRLRNDVAKYIYYNVPMNTAVLIY